jgi:hypothetical protein
MLSLARLLDSLRHVVAHLPFVSPSEREPEVPMVRLPVVKMRSMKDIRAMLPFVDDFDAAERARTDGALESALSMSRPKNWWGTGAGQRLLRAARDEGLPLMWVPRAATIKELDNAPDADARLAVMAAHQDEIISDCEDLLNQCTDEDLNDRVSLALLAVDAMKAGHHQAAMALAVAIAEPLAVWASTPRVRAFESKQDQADWEKQRKNRSTGGKYNYARIEIGRLPPGDVEFWDFNDQVLMLPVPRFFTSFFPERGDPVPTSLSRHAVVHQPTLSHFSEINALLSIMLVSSILRSQEEWIEEVRHDDARCYDHDYADD